MNKFSSFFSSRHTLLVTIALFFLVSVAVAVTYTVKAGLDDDNNPVFDPLTVSISLNDCVKWDNLPGHNVAEVETSASTVYKTGGFRSGAISALATYTKCFEKAGTYFYICEAHSGMAGTVVVNSSSLVSVNMFTVALASLVLLMSWMLL